MKIKLNITLWVLLLLFASVVHAAENQERPSLSDAEIRQRIVGTWMVNLKYSNGTFMEGSVSILRNRTCSANASILKGERKIEFCYECVWEVKDGYLTEIVKKTSYPKLVPLGKVTRDYVIRLDEKKFVYRTENGKIVARERIKNTGVIHSRIERGG